MTWIRLLCFKGQINWSLLILLLQFFKFDHPRWLTLDESLLEISLDDSGSKLDTIDRS